jgi:hypothetical protein
VSSPERTGKIVLVIVYSGPGREHRKEIPDRSTGHDLGGIYDGAAPVVEGNMRVSEASQLTRFTDKRAPTS